MGLPREDILKEIEAILRMMRYEVDDLLFSDDSDEALVLGGVRQEKN